MPINQDLLSYHQSISDQLKTSENRIRHLIGSSHWATDGEHKESILRNVISEFCPEIYRVGTGFVCYPAAESEEERSSTQLDILITSKASPTLYKSGELNFVTPECANALIEVKTKLNSTREYQKALNKLIVETRKIRISNPDFWSGLFVYESSLRNADSKILELLQELTADDPLSVINCVCVGRTTFVRFWNNGQEGSGLNGSSVWHSYRLPNLAQAYFISNVVQHLSTEYSEHTSNAWFPIEGSKELNRIQYAYLSGEGVEDFING